MFYFPDAQTAGGNSYTGETGICTQDKLIGSLIGLARATEGNDHLVGDSTAAVTLEGLFATLTGADESALHAIMDKVDTEKRRLVPACYTCAASCGRNNNYDMCNLRNANEDIRSLKSLILFGVRGIAAQAYPAAALGYRDDSVHKFLYKGLFAIGRDDWGMEELLPILREMGEVNRKCMAMPHPESARVSLAQEQYPSLPVYVSPNVRSLLAEKFPISPASTTEEILKAILR